MATWLFYEADSRERLPSCEVPYWAAAAQLVVRDFAPNVPRLLSRTATRQSEQTDQPLISSELAGAARHMGVVRSRAGQRLTSYLMAWPSATVFGEYTIPRDPKDEATVPRRDSCFREHPKFPVGPGTPTMERTDQPLISDCAAAAQ